jgi:hypothetical protein
MTIRVAVLAAVVTCELVSGACASDGRTSSGGLPMSPASTDALTPTLPPVAATITLYPARRLRGHVAGRLLSMPWKLADVRNDGRILVVYFVSGDGIRPHGVNNIGFRVVESTDSVELIAVSRDDNPGPAEAGSLATGLAKIVLSQPLGRRVLLHAPTDSRWSPKLLTT